MFFATLVLIGVKTIKVLLPLEQTIKGSES